MKVDEGWYVKCNKCKGASSLIALERPSSTMSPSPRVNSYKEDVTHSPKRGAYSLGSIVIKNKFRNLANHLFLE
jgi:hypothetical protein